jgi:hypothetical protein
MADLRIAPHRQNQIMNAPLIERRALAPRLEVQVRVVSGDPGASVRLTRYFRLTERGLGELVAHAARLEAGAAGKGEYGFFNNPIIKKELA